jgi:hypothetical protein
MPHAACRWFDRLIASADALGIPLDALRDHAGVVCLGVRDPGGSPSSRVRGE